MSTTARRRLWRRVFLLIFLGAVLHFLVPNLTGIRQAWRITAHLSWLPLVISALLQVARFLFSGLLVKETARLTDARVTARIGASVVIAGASVGLLLAGVFATVAAAFRWYRRCGLSTAQASLASWLPIALDNGLLAVLAIGGLGYLLLEHDLPAGLLVPMLLVGLVLFTIVALLTWVWFDPGYLGRLAARGVRVASRLGRRRFDDHAAQVVATEVFEAIHVLKQGWVRPFMLAAAAVACDALSFLLIYQSAGYPVSAGVLIAGYAPALILGRLSPLPGGVGIVEAAMFAMFGTLGVPAAATVVAVLSYRLLSFWLPALLGFVLAFLLDRKL